MEMNLASWIILGILLVVVGFAVFLLIKNRKKGKCSCCSNANCPFKKK